MQRTIRVSVWVVEKAGRSIEIYENVLGTVILASGKLSWTNGRKMGEVRKYLLSKGCVLTLVEPDARITVCDAFL